MCDYLLQYFSGNRGGNDWQCLALPIPLLNYMRLVFPLPLSWHLSCSRAHWPPLTPLTLALSASHSTVKSRGPGKSEGKKLTHLSSLYALNMLPWLRENSLFEPGLASAALVWGENGTERVFLSPPGFSPPGQCPLRSGSPRPRHRPQQPKAEPEPEPGSASPLPRERPAHILPHLTAFPGLCEGQPAGRAAAALAAGAVRPARLGSRPGGTFPLGPRGRGTFPLSLSGDGHSLRAGGATPGTGHGGGALPAGAGSECRARAPFAHGGARVCVCVQPRAERRGGWEACAMTSRRRAQDVTPAWRTARRAREFPVTI